MKNKKTAPRVATRSGSGQPADLAFETALTRVVLCACARVEELVGGAAPRRTLVNYLRGNQTLPFCPSLGPRPKDDACRGLLCSLSAGWLNSAVEKLAEEGYLERSNSRREAYSLTTSGARFSQGSEKLSSQLLPRPAVLGENPEVEEALTVLRRRLANEEGRPPFSIFDNHSLAWIARHRPCTMSTLANAPGFGARRLEKYGRKVVNAVKRATRG